MAFNLNLFKGAFALEGARPTLFEARIIGPVGPEFSFHCKAAQLPGKTLGVVEIPYFGRKIKVHGDQTFAEWTVTVINEETFSVRNAFETWMSTINTHSTNIKLPGRYRYTALVTQFSKIGVPVKTYRFIDIWPSDISPIEVSWESNDQVEEFTATLQYDWWEALPPTNIA